jgi:GDPmannose 4,6-dehydratase
LESIKNVTIPIIEVDAAYFRPTEVELLIGDATKSRTVLNWTPEYDLPALVKDMMASDVKLMKKETYLKEGGFRILNYFE